MLPLIEQRGVRRSQRMGHEARTGLVETEGRVLVVHAGDVGENAVGVVSVVISVPPRCWRSVGSVQQPGGDAGGSGWGGG